MTVRYWASARDAAGTAEEMVDAATLTDLRAQLAHREGLGRVCAASSYLVDGRQADDDVRLPQGCVVDVLPPFAGG